MTFSPTHYKAICQLIFPQPWRKSPPHSINKTLWKYITSRKKKIKNFRSTGTLSLLVRIFRVRHPLEIIPRSEGGRLTRDPSGFYIIFYWLLEARWNGIALSKGCIPAHVIRRTMSESNVSKSLWKNVFLSGVDHKWEANFSGPELKKKKFRK